MTYGQFFMRMNPNVKVVENGTCVWIFFDEVNHDTMRKGWWDKEIPDDANDAGWISVKDRLPENELMVIGYTPVDGYMFIGFHRTKVSFGYDWSSWYIITSMRSTKKITKKVTHWMPLPEPPKEET